MYVRDKKHSLLATRRSLPQLGLKIATGIHVATEME